MVCADNGNRDHLQRIKIDTPCIACADKHDASCLFCNRCNIPMPGVPSQQEKNKYK